MSDAAELGKDLAALDVRATHGPWARADWTLDDGPNKTTIESSEPETLGPGCSSFWPGGIRKLRIANTQEGERPDEDADLIVALRNNLPAILDALACKAAVDAIRADSTAPFDSEDVAERAAEIRATWEQR